MHLFGKWFMFLFDPAVEASLEFIGSNTSLVANFGSTLSEAYIRIFGNDPNSNVGFSLGTSNLDATTPCFVIGEVTTSPQSAIAPDLVIRQHQIGIGTNTPLSKLHVESTGSSSVATFYDDGTLAMLIANGGSIGIGTNVLSNGSVLTVQGNTSIHGNISANNLVTSAFTDTTNATNITTGTLTSNVLPNTSVNAGTYGGANIVPQFTVDAKGRITSILNIISSNVDVNNVVGLAAVATSGDYNSLSNITFYLASGGSDAVYTSGNVGIGTSSPSSQLDVFKDARINRLKTSLLQPDTDLEAYVLATSNVNVGGEVTSSGLVVANTININITEDGNNHVTNAEFNASDVRFRVLDSGETFILGNVGIGTTLPTKTLYVDGDVLFSGGLWNDTTEVVSSATGLLNSNVFPPSGVLTGTYGSASAVPVFTVDAKGRVTSVSDTSISINSSAVSGLAASATTDTTNATNITSGTLSADRLATSGVSAATYGNASNVSRISVDSKGRVTSAQDVQIVIPASSVTGLAVVATSGDYNSLSNVTFVLNNGNAVYTNGNVGIGTSSPLAKLDVNGTINATNLVGNGSSITDINATFITTGTLANERLPPALNISATSQAIRIDSNGNVGIGTATPSARLHIAGDVYSSGTLTTRDLVVFGDTTVLNTTSSNTEQMVITNAGTGPALKVIQSGVNSIAEFYDSDVNGSVPSMVVSNGGNVGIGTNTPLKTLHVQGDVNFTGSLYQNNALYISSQWTTGVANNLYYNDGNLGIGTTNPLQKLHVEGNVKVSGNIQAGNISGDGSSLSNLNATYINAGTIGNSYLPTAISQTTFTASSSVSTPTLTSSGTAINVSGKSLSNIADIAFTGSLRYGTTDVVTSSGILNSNVFPVSGVSAGTYGNGSNVSRITVDTTGRVTSLSNVSILIPAASVTGLATVATSGDYNSLSNITFTKSGINAIYTAGNVGIGTTSPAYVFHAEGDSYLSHVFTTEVTMTSDSNLKTNVQSIANAMDTVRQLRGVHFDWIAKDSHSHTRRSLGLIAQEVEAVLPQLVHDDAYGHKSISYGNMIGLLVEALKQQDRRIQLLEDKLRT